MKHAKLLLLLPLLALVACENPNKPDEPGTGGDSTTVVIPSSFPKKHLIEHFTSEACPNCPPAMEVLDEYVKNNSNFIWVSHHAGYADDQFTVKGSKTIAGKFGINFAPAMILDRTEQTYKDESEGEIVSELVFHPYYINELLSELEETTYASIEIKHTYDAANKDISINVSGLVADTTVKSVKLTVLIKENNLIGEQADNYGPWEGWEEFRHNKVTRIFVTDPMGTELSVKKQKYGIATSVALDEKWNADNCVIVAYITESTKNSSPVINAEQVAVINGKGGEDAIFEGIKAVEVPATYPEVTAAPTPLSNADGILHRTEEPNVYILQAKVPTRYTVGSYGAYPLVHILLVSDNLSAGEFPINSSMENNTAVAGFRNDEEFYTDGSMLFLCEESYLNAGYIYPFFQWLLVDGKFVWNEDNTFSVNATTLAGYSVEISGAIRSNAPQKKASLQRINADTKMTIVPFALPEDVRFSL